MRVLTFILLIAVGGFAAMASANDEAVINIERSPVVCSSFIGIGAEWDPYGYVANQVTDEEYATVAERVRWMRLPVARVMMQTKWCYFDDSRFDWDTPHMRALYRQLDLCEALGTTVFLTDWGGEKEWTTAPGIAGADDPKYARVIGTYLEHLLKTKGYTCIRYFIMGNEPNWEVNDWECWKAGVLNLHGELTARGLADRLTLAGSDTSQSGDNEAWHRLAVDELQHVLGAYDIHRYAQRKRVREGGLEAYWQAHWDYARENDPEGADKPCIVGEAGMNDDAVHPSGSKHIDEFGYGVFMADYAVQAARAGSAMVSAWMLDDNGIPNFFWGLWTDKHKGMRLRPWFYPWSLLARYFPTGAVIYAPEQPKDVRILAAQSGDDWTLCLVNRRDAPATVTLALPGGALAYRQYRYVEGSSKVDDKGFPVAEALKAEDGTVVLPSDAVVVLTTLR